MHSNSWNKIPDNKWISTSLMPQSPVGNSFALNNSDSSLLVFTLPEEVPSVLTLFRNHHRSKFPVNMSSFSLSLL